MSLSVPGPNVPGMLPPMPHPWRRLRALTDWTLHWAHLEPGVWGLTDHHARTITLDRRLTQVERRCTLAHELEHVAGHHDETVCDRNAARSLLPDVRRVGEALAWAHSLEEAADELWVDEPTLRARLEHLHPAERHYLRRRLADEHRHHHDDQHHEESA